MDLPETWVALNCSLHREHNRGREFAFQRGTRGARVVFHSWALLVARSAVVGLRLPSLDERVRQAAKAMGVGRGPPGWLLWNEGGAHGPSWV